TKGSYGEDGRISTRKTAEPPRSAPSPSVASRIPPCPEDDRSGEDSGGPGGGNRLPNALRLVVHGRTFGRGDDARRLAAPDRCALRRQGRRSGRRGDIPLADRRVRRAGRGPALRQRR